MSNNSQTHFDEDFQNDGPTLHTRIGFAIAWILIAVAGILGKYNLFY